MAAFKNVVTDYYIIDRTKIKRKVIEISNRRPEPGCENCNDREVVDIKKAPRLFVSLPWGFRVIGVSVLKTTNAPDRIPHNQSDRGLSGSRRRPDTANPRAVSFS